MGTLVTAGPAAAQSSEWSTDFGPLVLTLRSGDRLTGLFPNYTGRFEGTLDRTTRSITGIWRQPASRVRCSQESGGTFFWGQVHWDLKDSATLQGHWSYCQNTPGTAGVWNGTLVKGMSPIEGGAKGQEQDRGGSNPFGMSSGTPPSPSPGADAMEVARFLWGPSPDPARMRAFREDLSCDGRPDLVVAYLDLDSPDGPFLSVALREAGATLEQIPVTYLDFDTGTYASLCGSARMVDLSIHTLEPETAMDLTGFTSPPLCRVGLRLDDGMCDSVWVFTLPGENGLKDLVIGRN